MYKTVEEYSKEMTRERFDRFTEQEQLCPAAFALENFKNCSGDSTSECKECWNKALVGIEFLSSVPGFPVEMVPILQELQALEIESKSIKEKKSNLKEHLLLAMEKYDIKKWDNDLMTISYVPNTNRVTVDSSKLKKNYPDIYNDCIKTSIVKSSIRIKLKGDK